MGYTRGGEVTRHLNPQTMLPNLTWGLSMKLTVFTKWFMNISIILGRFDPRAVLDCLIYNMKLTLKLRWTKKQNEKTHNSFREKPLNENLPGVQARRRFFFPNLRIFFGKDDILVIENSH